MPGASRVGFGPARPTISIAGQDRGALADGLLDLLIAEHTSGLYRCEATFGNWGSQVGRGLGFLYFDRQLLDFGKSFTVKLGRDTIFDGRISGLEAHFPEGLAAQLSVLAEDRFQDLRMTRRTRSFGSVTDAQVIQQVATEYGLTPQVNLSGPSHVTLAQVNQSDLAFVRERARSVDAEVWMDGSTLKAIARGQRNGGSLQLDYGQALREFSVLADLAHQRTSVTVGVWDVASKTALQHDATDASIMSELGSDNGGAAILAAAFGDRKEALAHAVPLTRQDAQSHAEAFFRMTARRFVVGHGVADTSSALRVGAFADLRGLGPLFSGKYYVSEVRHQFDADRGMRTEFTAERPGIGQVAA